MRSLDGSFVKLPTEKPNMNKKRIFFILTFFTINQARK